jgi:LysM repeat protein
LVKLKVGGEELVVPLSEALSGYQRQADYTRKTQEVSFWKQVDAAMKQNPQMTLQYLAETYGVQAAQQAQANAQSSDDDWGVDDPVLREVRELKQAVAPLVQDRQYQAAERQIQTVLQGLQQKYGDIFDPDEVVNAAIARGVQDPAHLELVFRDIAFDRLLAQGAARTQQATTVAQQDALRKAAAQQAATATGASGGSARGGNAAARPQTPRAIRSPRDAVLAAFDEAEG